MKTSFLCHFKTSNWFILWVCSLFIGLESCKQKEPEPAPIAKFSYYEATTSLVVPTTIVFLNESENADTYLWTYPGGTATDKNLTLDFKVAGNYVITLRATGKGGNNTYSMTVRLTAAPTPQPIANFTYSPNQNLTVPVKITFTNTSKNADSYKWDFGDGTTSTETNPVKEFTKAGTFKVKLTATGKINSADYSADVLVSPPVNPYGGNNGKIGFWNKINDEGSTSITISNSNQTLKNYWTSAPDCANANVPSYTLAPGNYDFVAANDAGRRWQGKVSVTSAQCALFELKKENGFVSLPSGAVIRTTATSRNGETIKFTLDIAMTNGDNTLSNNLSAADFSVPSFSGNNINYSFVNDGTQIMNGTTNAPYSAALLLDQSGSIRDTDPNNQRIEAAKIFCKSLGTGDNVHLSAFASGGLLPYELTIYGNGFSSDGNSYLGTLDDLKTKVDGGTPLYKSAYSMVDYTSKNAPNVNKALVVFTDGKDNGGGRTPDDIIRLANQQKIKVFMIGLKDTDIPTLAYIANQTGGAFMQAQDAAQLMTMFGSLGKLLNGTANFYRTTWTMTRTPGVPATGNYWVWSSVQVKIGGRTVYVPFRVDY